MYIIASGEVKEIQAIHEEETVITQMPAKILLVVDVPHYAVESRANVASYSHAVGKC